MRILSGTIFYLTYIIFASQPAMCPQTHLTAVFSPLFPESPLFFSSSSLSFLFFLFSLFLLPSSPVFCFPLCTLHLLSTPTIHHLIYVFSLSPTGPPQSRNSSSCHTHPPMPPSPPTSCPRHHYHGLNRCGFGFKHGQRVGHSERA